MFASDWQTASFRRILIFAFCFLLFAWACVKKPPEAPKPKKPVISIPTEPAPSAIPYPLSPKREASQKMVQVGKEYLESGALDKAVQTFQEAINVDSENGVAYFFLAFSLFRSGLNEDALGLLDRADTLLAPYPDWHEEVIRLREMIEEGKEESQKEKPEEGYY